MRRPRARTPRPREHRLLIAHPHGFCAGVRHAVALMESALAVCPPPLYGLKDIVHNRQVVARLRRRGVRFVEDIRAVPRGACVLFSAHGVSPAVRAAALERNLRVLDATCPYVHRLHTEVKRYAREGFQILLVGHRTHDEIIGVRGEAPESVTVIETAAQARAVPVRDPGRVAVVTQTTLGVRETDGLMAALRARFPALRTAAGGTICMATRNRQRAVETIARLADCVLVLGSPASSNSNRLVETARAAGARARLVASLSDLESVPLGAVRTLGLTAGASTPDSFVAQALARLRRRGFTAVEHREVVRERVRFPLPRALARLERNARAPSHGRSRSGGPAGCRQKPAPGGAGLPERPPSRV